METWKLPEVEINGEATGKRKEMQIENFKNNQRGSQHAVKRMAVGTDAVDHQILMAASRHLITLDTQVRHQEAAVVTTLRLPATFPEVNAMLKAGRSYQAQVQAQGKNHQLGSPHLHIWAAFIMAMSKREGIPSQLYSAIEEHISAANQPTFLINKVLLFRQSQMKDPEHFKLQVVVCPELKALWNALQALLEAAGALALSGTAPKGPHMRRLLKLMQQNHGFEQ
jgi:hypothetical protein